VLPDSISTQSIPYHAYTIWLFARDYFKDAIVPCTAFAVFGALSGPVLGFDPNPSIAEILRRAPLSAFWLWLTILLFSLHNQHTLESVQEDAVNKPWRPLPAKRLTISQANYLMLATYPLACLVSLYAGVICQYVLLTLFTVWYNEVGGADQNAIVRSFLNAAGYSCLLSGALLIVAGSSQSICNPKALQWVSTILALIFTTIHVQDFRDQYGDRLRGRHTILLALGSGPCRWTVVVGVTFWSLFVPTFWKLGFGGYLLPATIGVSIVYRVLFWRDVEADRVTYKLWCLWFLSFCPLPWFSSMRT
jgi:4-hydroxybenzoate polyprenyltransferase